MNTGLSIPDKDYYHGQFCLSTGALPVSASRCQDPALSPASKRGAHHTITAYTCHSGSSLGCIGILHCPREYTQHRAESYTITPSAHPDPQTSRKQDMWLALSRKYWSVFDAWTAHKMNDTAQTTVRINTGPRLGSSASQSSPKGIT